MRTFLGHLSKNFKDCWETGADLSIDEMTLGFQGRHGSKLRITYKRVGDGFQCDSICDEGYCFAFIFCHDTQPKYKHNLCNTSEQVIWLIQQLKNNWSRIYMDNLFNSVALYKAAYEEKALMHGVCRTNGRGLPQTVIQREEKSKRGQEQVKGTVKAAWLKADSNACPPILACLIYDTKPVHFISTVASSIEWVKKQRTVFNTTIQQKTKIIFPRLNIIDDYNNGMGNVDISDQLRLQYRLERFIRNRKWWWSFFLWGVGQACVNAYIIYKKKYKDFLDCIKNKKRKPCVSPMLSHVEFLKAIAEDLMWPENQPQKGPQRFNDQMSLTSQMRTRSQGVFVSEEIYLHQTRVTSLTRNNLAHAFPKRFDWAFHPSISALKKKPCQLCKFKLKEEDNLSGRHTGKYRKSASGNFYPGQYSTRMNSKDIRRCLTCNVELCYQCFNEFHGVDVVSRLAI